MALVDSPWRAIVSTALVGTEQQVFQLPIAPGNLGHLLAQLNDKPTGTALLSAAATVALHQRVGWLPEVRSVPTSEPCPSSDLPRCSPHAARYLQQTLQDQYPEVLPEWLALAANAGQRVPEMHLPALLDKGRQQRELRAAILPVLGQRGQWLAAQNPDWSYAVAFTTAADWETGTSAARLLYLQDLRSHAPDRARDLLQTTWKQESAPDRAKFLASFRTGLTMADELFLEQVLDDRSKEVRRIAANLLARLIDSRLCQRMLHRIASYITFKKAAGRLCAFEVALPETCDAEMQRDGIDPQPRTGLGERSWWLQQIVSATPLAFWEQPDLIGIADLVRTAELSEWNGIFLDGWLVATGRQRHPQWAQALSGHTSNSASDEMQGLLQVLLPEHREACVLRLIQTQKDMNEFFFWNVLLAFAQDRSPWSDELTEIFLSGVSQYLSASQVPRYWEFNRIFHDIFLCIPPRFLPELLTLHSAANSSPFEELLHQSLPLLQFRQDMMQAFARGEGT